MKKALIYISLMFIGGILILNGCKKDKTAETIDSDTQTAQDNSLAEGTFNDVNNIASQAVDNGSLPSYRMGDQQNGILSACATVTVIPNVPPTPGGNVTVDFGSAPCLCNYDLRYRKGIINIAYTGHYRDSGTVITVTFNNYYVGRDSSNMYKVMGTKTVTNTGHDANGYLAFSINVNGSLINTAGQTMNWTSQRTREWIAGESTIGNWLDDEYLITGSINGTNFSGASFNITITQALHIALSCHWIESGKLEFTPGGKPTRYVDYGYGSPPDSCDNQAKVTISGHDFYITLP